MTTPTRLRPDREPESLDADSRLASTIAAYNSMSGEYARRYARGDLREHRLRFQQALGQDLPVLDAGCGAGRDCSLFEGAHLSPVGIDLSDGLLSEARRVTGAPLVQADVRRLPFKDSTFQGIWCCAVLLHLDAHDVFRALREMSRVIVSGGALFLSVREGTGDEWRSNPSGSRRWFQLYSRGELSDLAMEAGFVVLGASVEPGVVSPGHWVNMHARSK